MRANSIQPKLQTGHLHIPMLQTADEVKKVLINSYKIKNSDLLSLDISNYIGDLLSKNKEIIEKKV